MTRICIFHPNLGIGGAERLIIEIALSLKRQKHSITIFTNYHDKAHCFSESKDKLNVNCVFSWIPDSIFGGFKVYLAAFKTLLLTLYFILFYINEFDFVIVDQISVVSVPLLRTLNKTVVFYCHFPDQFLTERKSLIKKIYRIPIDWFEIFCIGLANKILVNSKFTLKVLTSFEKINDKYKRHENWIKIIYPCVRMNIPQNHCDISPYVPDETKYLFVSINRFNPMKLIQRILIGMQQLNADIDDEIWNQTHCVIMGGCDPVSNTDTQYYKFIHEMAINFKLYNINDPLKNKVTFIKNPSEQLKFSILEKALALIYTPDYEHFGIVPVEAMFACVPVITSATGGPLESVIDGVTGFHIENFSIELVEKMKYFIKNPEKRDEMGHAGHAHCLEKFSTASLDKHLCRLITDLKENKLIK